MLACDLYVDRLLVGIEEHLLGVLLGLDENFFCLTEVLGVDGLNVPLEKLLKLDN